MVVMFLGLIMAANMNVHAAQPVKTLEDLGVTEKGGDFGRQKWKSH